MSVERRRVVAWVAAEVMPHEGAVRAWLRRSRVAADEIDDLIQEAYCKLSGLDSVDHIPQPDGYFFQTVRNLWVDRMRRKRVVRIETLTEVESLSVYSDELSPERITAARRELAKVMQLIQRLPERCKRVIELRKVHGVPQREIARQLGISESAVENEGVKGMRLITQALREDGYEPSIERARVSHGRSRNRPGD
jgi:RNA polymerase sigma factor (sigma-70 family)